MYDFTFAQSESGDWFIIPKDKQDVFWEDELNDRDIDYATYVNDPSCVTFGIFRIKRFTKYVE